MSDRSLQPFGFGFEVNSHHDTAAFKTALRRKWKPWFDNRSGARGWMIGPVVYLWLSPYFGIGPSAVAVIQQQRAGTRVLGVAGFDVVGTLMAIAIGAGLPVLMVALGHFRLQLLLLPLLCGVAMLIRARWHHEADPLVRFLDRIAQPSRNQQRFRHLTLNIDGLDETKPPTAKGIEAALEDLQDGGFLIISAASEAYMQVARAGDAFVIEMRDGDSQSHFRAIYADGRHEPDDVVGATFSFDVTLKALLAYAQAEDLPAVVGWRRLQL